MFYKMDVLELQNSQESTKGGVSFFYETALLPRNVKIITFP